MPYDHEAPLVRPNQEGMDGGLLPPVRAPIKLGDNVEGDARQDELPEAVGVKLPSRISS